MPLPFRRARISPDFFAVPAEQPVPAEVRIADLDQRNAIRPARGRVGSVIDNRRENP